MMQTTFTLPTHVHITDVGARDGLQNEKSFVTTEAKVELVNRLSAAGFMNVEATSFVSPKWVPQMSDAASVMAQITRKPGVIYSVLTPNMQGFEAALAAQAQEVVIFGAASEAFSQRNINCSIAESIARFAPVAKAAHAAGMRVRAAVSVAFGTKARCQWPAWWTWCSALLPWAATKSALPTPSAWQRLGRLNPCWKPPRTTTRWRALAGTFTTPTAKRWPMCWLACKWAWRALMRRLAALAAALMPKALLATWPPKTWCTCCTA
jgi:HMGL-like